MSLRSLVVFASLIAAGCTANLGGDAGEEEGAAGGACQVPGLAHQRVFAGLSLRQPVDLLQAPGDRTRMFVVEHTGTIKVFANNSAVSQASTFLDLTDRVKVIYESGLNDMAFHPNFAKNGEVYVTYDALPPNNGHLEQWRLSRFHSTNGGQSIDKSTEEILIALDKDADEHNAGKMAFGADGLLYVSVGDGGPSFDPHQLGQNTNVLFGKFLRLNVDVRGATTGYTIPPTNPFAHGNGRGEIYAWGLRNPWRWSFDRANGDLWAGDVGQDAFEEIDKIELGGNYGWSTKEALHCFAHTPCADASLRDPIVELPHPAARAVIGGYVYRGNSIPALKGTYVFGDFVSGKISGLFKDPISNKIAPQLIDSTAKAITAFAEDLDGELYVLDYSFGGIYKLVQGPCATAVTPTGPTYKYLMRAGISTQDDAKAYYASNIPAKPSPAPLTLNQWKSDNIGVAPVFSALYQNTMDLGFWREMTCTQTLGRGQGGCAVRNWKNPDDPLNPAAAANNLGTVTMNVSPEGFTRFFVFDPAGNLSLFAKLDSEGQKFVPGVCNACHTGHYQGAGGSSDLGSIFREFEPAVLKERPGLTRDQAEQEWFNLNQAIKTANQAIRGEADGAPTGTDHAKQGILGYLAEMYPSGAAPARDVHDAAHLPPSWRQPENPALDQAKADLFTHTVNPYCMGCHRVNAMNFTDYGIFSTLSADQDGKAVLKHYIELDPADPNRLKQVIMPQAELTWNNLRADATALDAVETWTIEATNPSGPQSRVTFEITNAGFTFWGQDIWVVGDVDALGAWTPNRGIKLDGAAFPTWRGTAILPQGQAVQFKAVAISSFDGKVLWESGNNHDFVVPDKTTGSVSFPWRK